MEVRANNDLGEGINYDNNPCKKTRLLEAGNLFFHEAFHYNTHELVDDNLTFVLRQRNGEEIGRHTVRNMKYWYEESGSGKVYNIQKSRFL